MFSTNLVKRKKKSSTDINPIISTLKVHLFFVGGNRKLCFVVRMLFSLIRRSRKDTYVPRTSAINVAQLSAWL